MKIVIVTETFLPATDGIVTRLTKAIDYMTRCGHEVIVIAPDMGDMPTNYQDAKIYAMPARKFSVYKQRPWPLPTRLVKDILMDFQPDIVHAVNPIALAASGVKYAIDLQLPLICSFHTNLADSLERYHLSLLKPLLWAYLRRMHNSAPINLVTSQAMFDLLHDHGIKGLELLPIGVDLEKRDPKYYSDSMRSILTNNQPDKKLLIFVGQLAAEKEIQTLKPLLDKRDDVCLAIIGDGSDKKKLEAIFKDSQTVFTGLLDGQQLSAAYASADAFVSPVISETLGTEIIEAMASGTPVIAAESKPALEQITPHRNGLIYQRANIDSLIACVDILAEEEAIKKMTAGGRVFADRFSWDNASAAILEAYEKTIDYNYVAE